ncbi:expansin-like protein [Aphelenchoides avenae]|nr:expansin-like protein [Aphelenchus avenae]
MQRTLLALAAAIVSLCLAEDYPECPAAYKPSHAPAGCSWKETGAAEGCTTCELDCGDAGDKPPFGVVVFCETCPDLPPPGTPPPTSGPPSGPNPNLPYYNKPYANGGFTLYGGVGGRGSCGLDVTSCSAAGATRFVSPNAQWGASTLPDGRWVLKDPMCEGMCVKIEYNGKTGVFPVTTGCNECTENRVGLHEGAFSYFLNKNAGVVNGGVTITYIFCNTTQVTTC